MCRSKSSQTMNRFTRTVNTNLPRSLTIRGLNWGEALIVTTSHPVPHSANSELQKLTHTIIHSHTYNCVKDAIFELHRANLAFKQSSLPN